MPPRALELEQAVLGAMILEPRCIPEVQEILAQECFYLDFHQSVYKAICELSFNNRQIDTLTVIEEVRACGGFGNMGETDLIKLTNYVTSSAHILEHARIIFEFWVKRELIRISGQLNTEAFQDSSDAFELLDNTESLLTAIRTRINSKTYRELSAIAIDTIRHIEEIRHRSDHLTGVPSGFAELDKITCGWQPTDLIILAARPSVGKTAFALNLAANAGVPVGFFSLEMSERQLAQRVMAAESGILLWDIRNGRMDDAKMRELFTKGLQPLAKRKIFVDDTAGIKLSDLKSKARRMVTKDGVKILFIDYLQLITTGQRFDRKDLEVGYISSNLKGLAKELNIPVVCLSQLSRDVEKRGAEPRLSDLRESGAIEQDADQVLFLYRQEGLDSITALKIEKNRNGTLERFVGDFNKETQKWRSLRVTDKDGVPMGNTWTPTSSF